MMIISTRSKKIDSNKAEVAWRTGDIKRGIMTVTVNDKRIQEDIAVAAELCAIYHLMYERNIFNVPNTYSGVGYKLSVSHGAIKKLVRAKSDKTVLWHYAAFLEHRMNGVEIEVEHSMEYMPIKGEDNVEYSDLVINEFSFERNLNIVNSPSIGKVVITKHAVEQYLERTSMGKPKDPLKSLMRQVLSPDLVENYISYKVYQHKVKKYGRADNIEMWSGRTSILKLLVVKDDDTNIKTLVTVFELKPQKRKEVTTEQAS